MSDFEIERIDASTGKYVFRNGIVDKSLSDITEEQMFEYIARLQNQLALVIGAIRAKKQVG